MTLPRALWEGLFHAVSAFNNAGFGLRSDSLVSYVGDGWIILPLAFALIIGGLGYPVVSELYDRMRERWRRGGIGKQSKLSVTTKVTLLGTAVLIVTGVLIIGALEWNNTLAGQPLGTRLLAAFFQGVTPRTAGFNAIDYGEAQPVTLMVTGLLMFIGGGSAGTAGGIKTRPQPLSSRLLSRKSVDTMRPPSRTERLVNPLSGRRSPSHPSAW